MVITISVLWLIFAILFLLLGVYYWRESSRYIPHMPTPERWPGQSSPTALPQVAIMGTPLDQPLQDFVRLFNERLDQQKRSAQTANRNAAYGYFLAALTAILSLALEIWPWISV